MATLSQQGTKKAKGDVTLTTGVVSTQRHGLIAGEEKILRGKRRLVAADPVV